MSAPNTSYALVLSAFFAVLASTPADACTCLQTGTHTSQVESGFEASVTVFAARVASVSERRNADGLEASAEMRVLEVWKGPMRAGDMMAVGVAPSRGGLSCQYPVKSGEELMIYAFSGPPYELIICSLSGPLSTSKGDRPLLDKLRDRDARRPSSAVEEPPNTSSPRTRER